MSKLSFPEYPRTPHLFKMGEISELDIVAENFDVEEILNGPEIDVQEKVDGAAIAFILTEDDEFAIRNRSNRLKKGYIKDTPAKIQFRSAWNYAYENKSKFERLNKLMNGPVAIYGEWLYGLHGIEYNRLTDYFLAFEIYIPDEQRWLNSIQARNAALEAGFQMPPQICYQKFTDRQQLIDLLNRKSEFSQTENIEGIFLKINDDKNVIKRFKLIHQDYQQGRYWNPEILTKQTLFKG